MNTTPVSLLERLRRPDHDARSWERFVDLYTPLLYSWSCRLGMQEPDAADLVQDVLVTLVRKMPAFEYDARKSFRGWLRTMLLNQFRNRQRRVSPVPLDGNTVAQPGEANGDPALAVEEAEYRQYLSRRALQLIQEEFQPTTWKACWEFVVQGRPADEVARELGITANAVYLAKARVLARLRRELDGLLN